MSPIFKEDEDLHKQNYKTVSILFHTNQSVFYAFYLYNQIDNFMASK